MPLNSSPSGHYHTNTPPPFQTALAICQNIANNNISPMKYLKHPGYMDTLQEVVSQEVTEMNQVARQKALHICQKLSLPNTTRQHGKLFDAMLNVMSNMKNFFNATASEKALATITSMSNKKENTNPMAQNAKFISKLIEYCKLEGEKKRWVFHLII